MQHYSALLCSGSVTTTFVVVLLILSQHQLDLLVLCLTHIHILSISICSLAYTASMRYVISVMYNFFKRSNASLNIICKIWIISPHSFILVICVRLLSDNFFRSTHCGCNNTAVTRNHWNIFSDGKTCPLQLLSPPHLCVAGVLYRHVIFHITHLESATSRMFTMSDTILGNIGNHFAHWHRGRWGRLRKSETINVM